MNENKSSPFFQNDEKIQLTQNQTEILNNLYSTLNSERICYRVFSIIYFVCTVLCTACTILFAMLLPKNIDSMLYIIIALVEIVVSSVVLTIANIKSYKKANWYFNTPYVDHRYIISRSSRIGILIVNFLFNTVAFVFSVISYVRVKKNKTAYAEIVSVIESSYDPEAILEVRHLSKKFPIKKNFLGKVKQELIAVNDVSFTLKPGETLGIVGESGCGKTTMGRAILKLHQPSGGQIIFEGKNVTRYESKNMREIRKKMQIIFQDPYSSLPPRSTVGGILSEPVHVHKIVPQSEEKEYVLELMAKCGLRDYYYERYPHEFSGGQRQRICIARALSVNPKLVVCDEPVSALDVSIQAQIINLLKQLQQDMNLTYLFISHDLSVVKFISDKIGVMYLGSMVEFGTKEEIFANPLHPYTQALFSAIPQPDPDIKMNRIILKGDIPSPANPPKGCRFHTRCPHAMDICKEQTPEYKDYGNGHCAACHLLDKQ